MLCCYLKCMIEIGHGSGGSGYDDGDGAVETQFDVVSQRPELQEANSLVLYMLCFIWCSNI